MPSTLVDRPRVHLFYNTNPIRPTDPSYPEETRRPNNDYLCGYLSWRLDRLAHARHIAMSAAVLEGFAHVPAEVTCRMCWDKITALTISMGLFAKAMRSATPPRPDSTLTHYMAESNAALTAACDAIRNLATSTPIFLEHDDDDADRRS
jgi:hypothetical protein